MTRKDIKHIVETFWESHTTKDGTKYETFSPEILATVLMAVIEAYENEHPQSLNAF